MTSAPDWQSLRVACMGRAARRGCTQGQAEDVAQDAMVCVLERAPDDPIGYALVVSDRLAIKMLQGEARMCELRDEPMRDATQESHVLGSQLAFALRVAMPGTALDSLVEGGGIGRVRRMRARAVLHGALWDAPGATVRSPPMSVARGGRGEGVSSNAGRLTDEEKKDASRR